MNKEQDIDNKYILKETNCKTSSNINSNTNQYNNKKNEALLSKKKIKSDLYNLKPNIVIKNNLRCIEPYNFTYKLWVKGRWINNKILDVLENEFKQYPKEYFEKAISDGKILINNNKVDNNYILKKNDFLSHNVVRHENPIININKLDIIFENNDYVVVDKPSSWPVHVCGGYQFNTLHRILIDEYNYKEIKMLHRLDKHTSGIVILSKNSSAAEKFRVKIMDHEVGKTYLARVKGKFDHNEISVVRAIKAENRAKGMYTDCDDNVQSKEQKKDTLNKSNLCKDSLSDIELNLKENAILESKGINLITKTKDGVINKKNNNDNNNVNELDLDYNIPKYAETFFKFLFYDVKSNTSVVIAKPKTGRTHQIRIHLRYLGFPIANDPCYGGIIYNDLEEIDSSEYNEFKERFKENNNKLSVSDTFSYKIWLHAWKYKFGEYNFETKRPNWSLDNYIIDYKF